MKDVDDLKSLVECVRKKKGRMDAAERVKATQLIATILLNPEEPLGDVLPLFEDLQSEAVADGVGIAWPTLLPQRRLEIRRWLPLPRTERAQRRIALFASRVAGTDGGTAIDLLDKLIPERPNKELRQLLTTTLFSDGQAIKFENLYDASSPNASLRIFRTLATLAFDSANGIDPMARYRISVAALKLLVTHKLEQSAEGTDLLSKIVVEVERWPQGLREQFDSWLKNETPHLSQEFFPLKKTASLAQRLTKENEDQKETERKPESFTLENYLEQRSQALAAEAETLARLSVLVANSRAEAERQLAKWQARESELSKRLLELDSTRAELERKLADAVRRSGDLENALRRAEHEREVQHERLSQQISANANGRIDEFKNQLALTLSQQMIDLPDRDVEMSAELGRVLLLQFHQLIHLLEDLGINVGVTRSLR